MSSWCSSTLASKALLCVKFLQEDEQAGPPRGTGSLGVCLWGRGKDPDGRHSSDALNNQGNAYEDYDAILTLKFEQEALF